MPRLSRRPDFGVSYNDEAEQRRIEDAKAYGDYSSNAIDFGALQSAGRVPTLRSDGGAFNPEDALRRASDIASRDLSRFHWVFGLENVRRSLERSRDSLAGRPQSYEPITGGNSLGRLPRR